MPPATHKGQSHPDATYLPTAIDPVIVAEMTPTEWAQGGRGLGSCFDDWEVCFWGTFFSCCLYGQIKVRSGRATQCNTGCCEMVLVYLAAGVASYILGMILAAIGLAQAASLVQWAITGAGMGFLLGKNRDSLQAQCKDPKVCLTQTLV